MKKKIRHIFCFLVLSCFLSSGYAQDTAQSIIETAPDTTTITTSTNDNYNFKEATTPANIDGRKVPGEQLKKMKSDEDYWYVSEAPARPKKQPASKPKDLSWLNTLIWIFVIVAFVGLLIWFLATSNIQLFRRKPGSIEEETTQEELTENIFDINFDQEIQKAINANDYRLAVRLLYLRTLRQLSDRNLITYTHEKTNSDYLFQLGGTAYYKEFFKLTRIFDYTWYGQFELSQDNFSLIQNDFNSFKQQLS